MMIDRLIVIHYYCTDAGGTLRLGKAFPFTSPTSPNKLFLLLWGHPNIAALTCRCPGLSPAFPGGLLVFISSLPPLFLGAEDGLSPVLKGSAIFQPFPKSLVPVNEISSVLELS